MRSDKTVIQYLSSRSAFYLTDPSDLQSNTKLLHKAKVSELEPFKSMWYFIFKVSPKPNSNVAKEAGGAYVNCWINFREQEGAEHLAKFYLEREGWDYEETTDARWVQKEDYEDDPEGMQHFLEAETDSGSFVIVQWGLNGEEED